MTASGPFARICMPKKRISIRHGSEETGGFIRYSHPVLPMLEGGILNSHSLEDIYQSARIENFAFRAGLAEIDLLRKQALVDELLQASLNGPGSDVHALRDRRGARKREFVRVPPEGQHVDEDQQLGWREIQFVLA